MTDIEETIINDTPSASSLSPGDVLDLPLQGENEVISSLIDGDDGDDTDLDYLGDSVFDERAMAPLSQKSIVSIPSLSFGSEVKQH